MTHTVRSIDALISGIPEAQPINPTNSPAAKVESATETKPQENVERTPSPAESTTSLQDEVANNRKPEEKPESAPITQENTDNTQESAENSEKETDEYGNPLPKSKTYTEEEVQKMIRDRLKRGSFAQQQPTPEQAQQAKTTGFEYDENSELSWSQQMEKFVENTMVKVSQRKQAEQSQVMQHQAQVEFESKFQNGMSKYPDFVQTLSDKPVTDNMMMAVRGLENPAAFLYTAAKRMPGELERIAKINDPYVQVAEMGRLHERLSKPKPTTRSPNPLSKDRGDLTEKPPAKVSIDHLIAQDAQSRFRR